jgi:hypothetical protein
MAVERTISFDRDREKWKVDSSEELSSDGGTLFVVKCSEERFEHAGLDIWVCTELFRLSCGGEKLRRKTESFRDESESRVCYERCFDELIQKRFGERLSF